MLIRNHLITDALRCFKCKSDEPFSPEPIQQWDGKTVINYCLCNFCGLSIHFRAAVLGLWFDISHKSETRARTEKDVFLLSSIKNRAERGRKGPSTNRLPEYKFIFIHSADRLPAGRQKGIYTIHQNGGIIYNSFVASHKTITARLSVADEHHSPGKLNYLTLEMF